jgi:magnesium chelatase subunit D
MRVVELPINASEDRVVGSVDVEAALRHGLRVLHPGVLAEANRAILYADEVNLLDDHIVDVLLDAAATGVNVVEREGISVEHPSRFILVGTMNPEEGELRPQLLDRFGLCVDVSGIRDPLMRVAIIQNEDAYRRGDSRFFEQHRAAGEQLAHRLQGAVSRLGHVVLHEAQREQISRACARRGVAGHRADIVAARAAAALAALDEHGSPDQAQIELAIELALSHRAAGLSDDADAGEDSVASRRDGDQPQDAADSASDTNEPTEPREPAAPGRESESGQSARVADQEPDHVGTGAEEQPAAGVTPQPAGETFAVKPIRLPRERRARHQTGKRTAARSDARRGRHVGSTTQERVDDLAIEATIRAAAPHQSSRRAERGGAGEDPRLLLESRDLRQKVRRRRTGNLIVFVVDASASMDAEQRMRATRGAVLSLLEDAYVRRDKVALVVFKNRSAEVVLRPTNSVSLARDRLRTLTVGGTTPLTHGLMEAVKLVRGERMRDPDVAPLVVLISDGRGNISLFKEEPVVEAQKMAALISSENIPAMVIDSARDHTRRTLMRHLPPRAASIYQAYTTNVCADLAERMGATYHGLFDLSRDAIVRSVTERLQ